MKPTALSVWVHDQRVGTLSTLHGRTQLRFDPEWRARPDRFVLSAHYEDLGAADPKPCLGLPPYFANLLFEGRLQEWVVASEGLGGGDLSTLARLGRDLPGAVRLEALADPVAPPEGEVEGGTLAGGPTGQPRAGGLRFSLAGVQLKLSLAAAGARFTLPVHGALGCFIAKFADPTYPGVPEIEHATMAWSRACGLRTAETELRPVSDIDELPFAAPAGAEPALLVRRFDRTADGARPIHAEELAQAMGLLPSEKYRKYGWAHQLALVENLCPADVAEYLRRLLFVILSGNGDAHHKNWGLVYPDGRRPRLAPAYDQVATVVWSGAGSGLEDSLPYKVQGRKRYEELSLGGLCALARDTLRGPFIDGAAEVAPDALRPWLQRAAQAILDHRPAADRLGGAPIRRALDRHHARMPLLREL